MSKKSLHIKDIPAQLGEAAQRLGRYKVVIFLVLLVAVYGFVLLRINQFDTAEPTPDQISAQSNPVKSARIDKNAVKQLQQLQDNSVSVKTLFTETRNNPFQE